jgi:hypothetical protein
VTPHISPVLTSERLPVKEVMGRLDHLVEAVYERYKDRYFRDESTFLFRSQTAVKAEKVLQRSM